MPVRTFLDDFLITPPMHYVKIEKLSGGEKRRLYLLTVLMKNPNVLILDEPTNDLDILTLNVLEEYLKGYPGSVIIVSHDRFFLDKIADHLFIFEGGGAIKDFVGSYSGYRQYMKDKESQRKAEERAFAEKQARKGVQNGTAGSAEPSAQNGGQQKKRKLSYKEQRELEQLEKDIEALEAEKAALEEALSSGTLSVEKLTEASTRIGVVIDELDEKGMRWLELSDI